MSLKSGGDYMEMMRMFQYPSFGSFECHPLERLLAIALQARFIILHSDLLIVTLVCVSWAAALWVLFSIIHSEHLIVTLCARASATRGHSVSVSFIRII